jgi:hypothetical protein
LVLAFILQDKPSAEKFKLRPNHSAPATAVPFNYHQAMAEPECPVYKKLKERETRTHTAWTSFLYRNEVKPKLSEKAKRKHQKEEMEAYQQAHKARLSHEKTCPTCMSHVQA